MQIKKVPFLSSLSHYNRLHKVKIQLINLVQIAIIDYIFNNHQSTPT